MRFFFLFIINRLYARKSPLIILASGLVGGKLAEEFCVAEEFCRQRENNWKEPGYAVT
jgi:hypothetical protein